VEQLTFVMRVFRCGTGQFDDATRSRQVWAKFSDPRSSMTAFKGPSRHGYLLAADFFAAGDAHVHYRPQCE
jgi:hypothetical protein